MSFIYMFNHWRFLTFFIYSATWNAPFGPILLLPMSNDEIFPVKWNMSKSHLKLRDHIRWYEANSFWNINITLLTKSISNTFAEYKWHKKLQIWETLSLQIQIWWDRTKSIEVPLWVIKPTINSRMPSLPISFPWRCNSWQLHVLVSGKIVLDP